MGGTRVNRPQSPEGAAYYELSSTRDEYLAFHFPGTDPLEALLGDRTPPLKERYPFGVPKLWRARPEGAALDVGAATGRTTFDLARGHRVAWGIDLSATLVAAAREVQRTGRARYRTIDEGELTEEHDVAVDAAPNARFAVADALALPFPAGTFDTVVAFNLVDRVPDPGRALDELVRVTANGGTLIIGSPYTWTDGFTPRERWLGGFVGDEGPVRGSETIRTRLASKLRLLRELRMVFFIPHHARSGQLGCAHIQVYARAA